MRKRILPLLMALCLTLSLVPMALAAEDQPDTITLPNGEVREIPTLEADAASYALADTQSTQQTFTIDSETAFDAITSAQWQGNNTFIITEDLNLNDSDNIPSEWGGFIQYFRGNLIGKKADGSAPVISGIPNNCALIYGIIGGTIENLVFNHGSNAAFITFMPVNSSTGPNDLKMTDVTVRGNISLTGSDQSNYSPFVYCAPPGGITMTGCVNEADITGSIYGSVFYGYYPLFTGSACQYKFDKCVNSGDVTMQYAGMFFGNSSSVEGKVGADNLYLTITDCENNGKIRGTSGAKYFAAPVAEFGSNMQSVEDLLNPKDAEAAQAASHISASKIKGTGSLCVGNPLAGFGATLSGDTVTVTRATDEKDVDHYIISVSTYVNLWYPAITAFYGTDRVTVSQTISKTGLTENTFTPTLKVYGFADEGVGTAVDVYGEDQRIVEYNGSKYYEVVHIRENVESEFEFYVSTQLNGNGSPAGGGVKTAEIVTVAACKSDGTMLDCITVVHAQ